MLIILNRIVRLYTSVRFSHDWNKVIGEGQIKERQICREHVEIHLTRFVD